MTWWRRQAGRQPPRRDLDDVLQPPDRAHPAPADPVPPTKTPDNTRERDNTMTQHVTPQGVEAIVREDWQTDTLHVILRRNAPGTGRPEYAATTTNDAQTEVPRLDTDWVAPADTPAPTVPVGLMVRRDNAAAIHAALGEVLGMPLDYQSVRDEADALAADLAADLADVLSERDEARAEAVANGARAQGLTNTLHATQDTLALIREWHADTRARLERAETPPILATLDTMVRDHPADRVAALILAVPALADHLAARPSSTPVQNPGDDQPARLVDCDGDVWTRQDGDGKYVFAGRVRNLADLHRLHGPLCPIGDPIDPTEKD